MKDLNILEERLGQGRVLPQQDLSPYLTLRTPTRAEYFFEAKSKEDLIQSFKAAKEAGIPYFLLGGGTNLAVIAPIIKGLVVRNKFLFYEYTNKSDQTVDLVISSGYPMALLVKKTVDDGYAGFEYQLGLPGTIGGGIFMNSKWTHPVSYIGDNLVSAELLDKNGEVKTVDRSYFNFAYDYSNLQKTNELVLTATFRLKICPSALLLQRAEEAMEYRRKTQPVGVKSSGCFFRNISETDKERLGLPTTSAGYLIDKAGLKGRRIGAFSVSTIHANFIVNDGSGKTEDLVQLLKEIKHTVQQKFGIALSPEVLVI